MLGTGQRISFKIALIGFVVLCLCVSSWADCQTGSWDYDNGIVWACNSDCSDATKSCSEVFYDAYTYRYNYYTGSNSYQKSCNLYGASSSCAGGIQYFGTSACNYTTRCTTQAEADSVANSLNKVDSVKVCHNITYIDENFVNTQYMQLYRCPENYTAFSECEPLMEIPGTCGQNGYESGVQPPDSLDTGADCFASFQGDCYMVDKSTGNTFTCPCEDNSCLSAQLSLADGSCINPYAPKSSSSSSVSSSGSSSPSSSETQYSSYENISSPSVDSAGDWEYDYSGILNAINSNVVDLDNDLQSQFFDVKQQMRNWQDQQELNNSMVRANTQQIASNVDYTNTLIKQSVVPSINQASNHIANTITSANSSMQNKLDDIYGEWSGLWSQFVDTSYVDNNDYSIDTITYDTITSAEHLAFLDSMRAERSSIDSLLDSIDARLDSNRHDTIALDAIYDYSDSNEIKSKFSYLFMPGNTGGSCPVFEIPNFSFPVIGTQEFKIDFGNLLGRFDLCLLIRWIVRLATTIVIMFGTFRAVTTAFGSRD